MIVSAAIGSLLSIGLAACATRNPRPASAVVAVKVPPAAPPADLLACPIAPAGFPVDEIATLPPAIRVAAIRLAKAYAATASQLTRLIDHAAPGTCTP